MKNSQKKNGEFKDRDGLSATRHFEADYPILPFEFTIPLPPPRYYRIITERDNFGRIVWTQAKGVVLQGGKGGTEDTAKGIKCQKRNIVAVIAGFPAVDSKHKIVVNWAEGSHILSHSYFQQTIVNKWLSISG